VFVTEDYLVKLLLGLLDGSLKDVDTPELKRIAERLNRVVDPGERIAILMREGILTIGPRNVLILGYPITDKNVLRLLYDEVSRYLPPDKRRILAKLSFSLTRLYREGNREDFLSSLANLVRALYEDDPNDYIREMEELASLMVVDRRLALMTIRLIEGLGRQRSAHMVYVFLMLACIMRALRSPIYRLLLRRIGISSYWDEIKLYHPYIILRRRKELYLIEVRVDKREAVILILPRGIDYYAGYCLVRRTLWTKDIPDAFEAVLASAERRAEFLLNVNS